MLAYENLIVYQKAKNLNSDVYRYLKNKKGMPNWIKSQLGRASMSIMLNIAEGSGRFTKNDRKHFFITSRSSAFECASIIDFLFVENEITKEQYQTWKPGFEEISKILFPMIRNLEATQVESGKNPKKENIETI